MADFIEVFDQKCAEAQVGKRNIYSPGSALFLNRLAGIIISGFATDTYAYLSKKISSGEEFIAMKWNGIGDTELLKHNLKVRRKKLCQQCLLYKSRTCSGFDTRDGVSEDEEPLVEYVPRV